jgi:hypothetical protein
MAGSDLTDGKLLRLQARDATDLGIVSSMLQDAIAPLSDMLWLPEDRRFVVAVNRFRWEQGDSSERVAAGVSFANVDAVHRRNIDAARVGGFLNLLSVTCHPDESSDTGRVTVLLTFAGDAAIRLESASLLCHLEDFGEPWPTQWRPDHA